MSAIQRHLLINILSFIAAVYRRANTFDHFDTMLYEDKAERLIIKSGFDSDDFFTLIDPNSEDFKIIRSLPDMLQSGISVGGSRIDITPNIADLILTYLESSEFHELLKKIISGQLLRQRNS